jgi:hypothetical protein
MESSGISKDIKHLFPELTLWIDPDSVQYRMVCGSLAGKARYQLHAMDFSHSIACVSWSSFDNIGCGAFLQGDQSGIMTLFGAEYEESSSSSSSESSSPPRPVFVHEAARRKQTPQVCNAHRVFFCKKAAAYPQIHVPDQQPRPCLTNRFALSLFSTAAGP